GLLPGGGAGTLYRGWRTTAEPQRLGRLEASEVPKERGQELRRTGLSTRPGPKPPPPEPDPEEHRGRYFALGRGPSTVSTQESVQDPLRCGALEHPFDRGKKCRTDRLDRSPFDLNEPPRSSPALLPPPLPHERPPDPRS